MSNRSNQPLSRGRQTAFYVFLLLTPPAFFILLELVLRAFNYGGDLSAVTIVERHGAQYYTMNQAVGKRYFRGDGLYYRKGAHDFFEVDKSPNTLRIFIFGESTVAGFPYEYHATPCAMLRARLAAAYPDRRIEVINTGIAATNSYTVLDLISELVDYDPDLFIVYMGHNEFYGAFGIGSTVSGDRPRWMIQAYLRVQTLRTVRLLRDVIEEFSALFSDPVTGEDESTLMEEMVYEHVIGLDDPKYVEARSVFRSNYEAIAVTAREKSIPIILSTLVANERDLEPFVTVHPSGFPDALRMEYNRAFNEGLRQESAGRLEAGFASFMKAAAIDSNAAGAQFRLARAYEGQGRIEQARSSYALALDLDGLRFRAPTEFNLIIRSLAHDHNLPLADVEAAFRAQSPHGIIGGQLLSEHVHPTIEGYWLMSKVWFETIGQEDLVSSPPDRKQVDTAPDSLQRERLFITDVDEEIGRVKIARLRSRRPFRLTAVEPFYFSRETIAQDVAYRYVALKELSWGQAHLEAARRYKEQLRLDLALCEYQAIDKTDDGNPIILTVIGDLLEQLDSSDIAEAYYRRAVRCGDHPYARLRLGERELQRGNFTVAIDHLKACLSLDQIEPTLAPRFRTDARYLLASGYERLGELEHARKELSSLLTENPFHKPSLLLLARIKGRIDLRNGIK